MRATFTAGAFSALAVTTVGLVAAFSYPRQAQRQSCPAPRITDGDTLRCGDDRVRLLGIDAPELHGCPRGRQCVAGDARASKRSLVAALSLGPVTYQAVKLDRYGRTVAVVYAGSVNLSCWQLQRGQAAYVAKWDDGRRIGSACR